jgi:lipopolysaccharide assembly outer membrane protein LptD (OstA)
MARTGMPATHRGFFTMIWNRLWQGWAAVAACALLAVSASSVRAQAPAAPAPSAGSMLAAAAGSVSVAADRWDFDAKSGLGHGVGNVHIVYQDVTLDADEAKFNSTTQEVWAKGNIVVTAERGAKMSGEAPPAGGTAPAADNKTVWHADEIHGNMRTKQFEVGHYKAHSGVFYLQGDSATSAASRGGKTVIHGGTLTTCDLAEKGEPHYTMSASRITYRHDGSFTAWNVLFKAGPVPVFYLPAVWGSTAGKGEFEVKPGFSGRWGAFLLLSKSWRLSEAVTTTMHLDLRSRHGLALGNETKIRTAHSQTDTLLYGLEDTSPPKSGDNPDFNRRFDVTSERYRAKIYHREELADGLNLRMKIDKMSDIDFLENWFRKEYHVDPQPKSFADVTLDRESYSLSLSARKRVNDFWSEAEQLPMLKLDLPRQPLGDSGFYYQGQSSVGKMEMSWRQFDRHYAGKVEPADYGALRADSLHMFYYPMQLHELEIVPRAGGRVTYYDQSSQQRMTVNDLDKLMQADQPTNLAPTVSAVNYDHKGGSVLRLAAEAGVEVSSKFYRTWTDYKSERWNIDGLRHVVQPYANYTFAPAPTTDRDHLYFFDEVDRLVEQNFIRFGLRQRWETRRSNRIYTLASLENYADFHFTRSDGKAGPGAFGTVFRFDPKETFGMWANAVVDMGAPTLDRGEIGFGIGDKKVLRTELSYIYRSHYTARSVYSMGSSLTDPLGDSVFAHEYDGVHYVCLGFLFPINAKMDCALRTEYDVMERRLARQMIEVSRDMHCWIGTLRLEVEDGNGVALMFILTLKAFPGFKINAGM